MIYKHTKDTQGYVHSTIVAVFIIFLFEKVTLIKMSTRTNEENVNKKLTILFDNIQKA